MSEVVYVEDDPINAFVFERLLRNAFDVVHYETGESCLKHFGEVSPKIIFMDINLGQGKLDGIETMLEIRKKKGGADIPIVAITAFAFEEDEARFLEAGFDFYLSKPVAREQLEEAITKLAKKSNG